MAEIVHKTVVCSFCKHEYIKPCTTPEKAKKCSSNQPKKAKKK